MQRFCLQTYLPTTASWLNYTYMITVKSPPHTLFHGLCAILPALRIHIFQPHTSDAHSGWVLYSGYCGSTRITSSLQFNLNSNKANVVRQPFVCMILKVLSLVLAWLAKDYTIEGDRVKIQWTSMYISLNDAIVVRLYRKQLNFLGLNGLYQSEWNKIIFMLATNAISIQFNLYFGWKLPQNK